MSEVPLYASEQRTTQGAVRVHKGLRSESGVPESTWQVVLSCCFILKALRTVGFEGKFYQESGRNAGQEVFVPSNS